MLSGFPSEMNELIDLLVRERLMCTEGDENNATVWLSHEKLFDAWPLLREYVAANKKQLMDQTLLESRAKKWADMGEPWFSGLAFGRERKDFQRSAIPTLIGEEIFGCESHGAVAPHCRDCHADYLLCFYRRMAMEGRDAGPICAIACARSVKSPPGDRAEDGKHPWQIVRYRPL